MTFRIPPGRTAGLDTLRASAIALVFMYHYMVFVSGEATFGWASVVGWVGVDLFFVLSGYLIANQLFAGMARGQALSLRSFYVRRALRTLPVFWLVLAAFFLWPGALGGSAPPPLWRFLTFTQNLGLRAGTSFSHAWSLCIEEQFYLVLPVLLVIGSQLSRLTRTHAWLLMGTLMAIGIAARGVLWTRYGPDSGAPGAPYMTHIYYATLCRFDEFIPGVAVAMLKNFHRPAWDQLMARGRWIFAVAAAASVAMLALAYHRYYVDGVGYPFFMTTFGYSLLASSFALLVIAALSPASWLHRLAIPGAGPIALWSYSIYLSHKPMAHVLDHVLKPMGVAGQARLALIVLACVAAGALLHKLVEAPFLALRDRWVPSNFRPAAVGVSRVAPGTQREMTS